jgi:hypothetical protein
LSDGSAFCRLGASFAGACSTRFACSFAAVVSAVPGFPARPFTGAEECPFPLRCDFRAFAAWPLAWPAEALGDGLCGGDVSGSESVTASSASASSSSSASAAALSTASSRLVDAVAAEATGAPDETVRVAALWGVDAPDDAAAAGTAEVAGDAAIGAGGGTGAVGAAAGMFTRCSQTGQSTLVPARVSGTFSTCPQSQRTFSGIVGS